MRESSESPPRFTEKDTQVLIELYRAATPPGHLRRTPWTWAVLTGEQASALGRVLQEWVHYYNHVHAVSDKDLIPPCWPQHPGLAHELAVLVWAYYHVHHDPAATPLMAMDYHARYLTGFHLRLDRMLGRDQAACRAGDHPKTWRSTADEQLNRYSSSSDADTRQLIAQHFGFPA